MSSATFVQRRPSSAIVRCSVSRMIENSWLSAVDGSGTAPAASNSTPLWTSSVASPPSSRIMFGPLPSPQSSMRSVHHQYSSSVSPFQAKTGTPCGSEGGPRLPTTAGAAAAVDLEVGHRRERLPQALDIALGDVGDQPVGGERGHPQRLADLAGRLAGGERLGDGQRVAQPADHVVDQTGGALALLAQLEQQPRGGAAGARPPRGGPRPHPSLRPAGAGLRPPRPPPPPAPAPVRRRP